MTAFVDEAVIQVASGKGGDGVVHFRREAGVPLGGPDGGDGGTGGGVYVTGVSNRSTLYDYRFQKSFEAEDGKKGGRQQMHGRNGKDLDLLFPLGTIIKDQATGEVLADLTREGERLLLLPGGRGGAGNVHFKSSVRRAPEKATPGKPGQERTLHLELKLMADVGLIGLPNAGKSTLIRRVTNSQARVAAYPFTTLHPNLGVVRQGDAELVMADIPGLIEGASEGRGLGIKFLKHVQRAGALVHLVSLENGEDALTRHDAIVEELRAFDPDLPLREAAVVLTKVDLAGGADGEQVQAMRRAFEGRGTPVFAISGITGEGVQALVNFLLEHRPHPTLSHGAKEGC
jgi:GTP-binding protein